MPNIDYICRLDLTRPKQLRHTIVNFKKSILWLQDKKDEIENFNSIHSDYVSKV